MSQAIDVGTQIPPVTQASNLTTSVMYAGASGDFNPLHYDQDFAGQVSPTGGIIAHGMFSMGLASRALTAFAGGPEKVLEAAKRAEADGAQRFGIVVAEKGVSKERRPEEWQEVLEAIRLVREE